MSYAKSGKAVLAPLLPWQSAAAQKTRVEKLILAVNGLCDAPLTRYGHQDGPCTRASRLEVWAPPPVLHGAAWRTRGAEEGTFGPVGYDASERGNKQPRHKVVGDSSSKFSRQASQNLGK